MDIVLLHNELELSDERSDDHLKPSANLIVAERELNSMPQHLSLPHIVKSSVQDTEDEPATASLTRDLRGRENSCHVG